MPKPPFRPILIAKRYTEEHEMIAYDDATSKATLYITDYASKSLGDVVFVELPKEGTQVAKGGESHPVYMSSFSYTRWIQTDQIGAVESVKAASDIVELLHFRVTVPKNLIFHSTCQSQGQLKRLTTTWAIVLG